MSSKSKGIINIINTLVNECHGAARKSGWWTDIKTGEPLKRPMPELLCLVHSEISEALEGFRKGKVDEHLPEYDNLTVELADAMIRILDIAGGYGLPLGQALADKLEYNAKRADHKLENRVKKGGKKI